MKLSIRERIVLLGCLPPQGDYVTLKIIQDLANALGFSEHEIKKFKLYTKEEDQTIHWDEKAEELKEVTIGEKAMDVIVNSLKELNKKGKLTTGHLEVYEKFVEKEKT
jgi:xanthine dehydrogenase molybdopterin-binding subunit B